MAGGRDRRGRVASDGSWHDQGLSAARGAGGQGQHHRPRLQGDADGLFFVQGYNAQAAVNEQQIVLAAEITNSSTDSSQLDPMVTATLAELERAGVPERPEVIAADAGYWNEQHIDEIVANKHIPVLVAPDKSSRGTPRKTWTGGRYDWMRAVLKSERGGERYRKRSQTVEPVFGNTKHNKRVTRFLRRGRVKARTEWRLQIDDPQPHQALQPPNSHSGGLNGRHPRTKCPQRAHHQQRDHHDNARAPAPEVCETASATSSSGWLCLDVLSLRSRQTGATRSFRHGG